MGAPDVLHLLELSGLRVSLRGESLAITPAKKLTPDIRRLIQENKPGILAALENHTTSFRWLVRFADREPLEVYCNPDTTHADILERYPDALTAEPIPERITPAEAEAVAWPTLITTDDQRRTCGQCANLAGRRCLAAWRGEIAASRDYEPVRDIPRRCEGYAPGADDPDTRPGRERWPELMQNQESDND